MRYCLQPITRAFLLGSFCMLLLSSHVFGQAGFKVGDAVEVDLNGSSYPENQNWKKATILKIESWNGQVTGYSVQTDAGTAHIVAERHMRRAAASSVTPTANNPAKTTDRKQAVPSTAAFKVGDRVEVDKIMANNPSDAVWGKATIKAVDLANQRYIVTLDNFTEMSVLIRPGKIWIRRLNDGSKKPEQASCSFAIPPGPVNISAPASETLFKRLIWEQLDHSKKGLALGISFQQFDMNKPYKNVWTKNGRLKDFIPLNVTIYPVKSKQVMCEKFNTLIERVEWEIEYTFYKDEKGKWICKSGAPRQLNRTTIYTDR